MIDRKTLLFVIIIFLVSSCAGPVAVEECVEGEHIYGFWGGLWHGFIVFWSFLVSLFREDTVIYAINNSGGWYDFGFCLGAGVFAGGASKAA